VGVCCVAFLEEPVSHPFGNLFSKMLPSPFSRRKTSVFYYLGERPYL
jgi:hypothetical protein